MTTKAPLPDLSLYGGAIRCLLRLRENDGKPGISDQAFISEHLARHPEWQQRPGEADAATLFEIAKKLELADGIDVFRDYDRILAGHRMGRSILVVTERAPHQAESELSVQRYVTLLETMDEATMTLWCPYPSGLADVLVAVPRLWWDRWLCLGIVLRRDIDSPGASPPASV